LVTTIKILTDWKLNLQRNREMGARRSRGRNGGRVPSKRIRNTAKDGGNGGDCAVTTPDGSQVGTSGCVSLGIFCGAGVVGKQESWAGEGGCGERGRRGREEESFLLIEATNRRGDAIQKKKRELERN